MALKGIERIRKRGGVYSGDAAVTDVKSGKTFHADSDALLTGTLPTKTLSPANDTVEAGHYAATTLSAVDSDLATGNIKSGVTIFGKLGTVSPGAGHTDYEYEADLAAGANYVPPADTLFCFFAEANLSANRVNLEWYDNENSSWLAGIISEANGYLCSQSTNQRTRLINDDAGAKAIGLFGATWTGFTTYEYEADLAAAGTTYTPPVQTFFCWFTELLNAADVNLEWYDSINTSWAERISAAVYNHRLHQSASQRLRIINDDAATAYAIGLYGETY